MAFGLGFGFAKNYACAVWSPSSLFSAGEVGVWYDPADFSTLFQDSAGTTPVTAVEQPVGLILDKSGNGKHASQATAASRPTLKLIDGKYSLLFDGIDDSLATASINFTATDKMTVVAGVRKLSDAATGVLCELSASAASLGGGFNFFAPVAGSENFRYAAGNVINLLASAGSGSSYPAPTTNVVTGLSSISADVLILRINGTQAATSAADQGTGNFGNYPLFIGRRAGTSMPFNGHLYSLIVRGAQSTDAQIAVAETWVNSKTGAY